RVTVREYWRSASAASSARLTIISQPSRLSGPRTRRRGAPRVSGPASGGPGSRSGDLLHGRHPVLLSGREAGGTGDVLAGQVHLPARGHAQPELTRPLIHSDRRAQRGHLDLELADE